MKKKQNKSNQKKVIREGLKKARGGMLIGEKMLPSSGRDKYVQ